MISKNVEGGYTYGEKALQGTSKRLGSVLEVPGGFWIIVGTENL